MTDDEFDLFAYFRPIKAYWLGIVLLAVASVAAVVGILLAQPPAYSSTAVVRVDLRYTSQQEVVGLIEGTAYRVRATLGPGSVLIGLSAKAGTPERAEEQITGATNQVFGEIVSTLPDYEAKRDLVVNQINQIMAASNGMTTLGEQALLLSPTMALLDRLYEIDGLATDRTEALIYVRRPEVPTEATQPPIAKYAAVALALSLLVGYVCAWALFNIRRGGLSG